MFSDPTIILPSLASCPLLIHGSSVCSADYGKPIPGVTQKNSGLFSKIGATSQGDELQQVFYIYKRPGVAWAVLQTPS